MYHRHSQAMLNGKRTWPCTARTGCAVELRTIRGESEVQLLAEIPGRSNIRTSMPEPPRVRFWDSPRPRTIDVLKTELPRAGQFITCAVCLTRKPRRGSIRIEHDVVCAWCK